MNYYINNFTSISRGRLDEVKYSDCEYTLDELYIENVVTMLQDAVDGWTEWTIDRNSGIKEGDINLFMCSSTSKDNIRMLRSAIKDQLSLADLSRLDNLCDLYKEYAGKIMSIAFLESLPNTNERMEYAHFSPLIGFETPVPYDDIRPYISVSRTGIMTYVSDESFHNIMAVIKKYNPSIDLSWMISEKTSRRVIPKRQPQTPPSIMQTIKQEIIDIEQEVETKALEGEERKAFVKVRVNQGEYRKLLLKKYDHCCLCNVEDSRLLIASHIKPWADSNSKEKLDECNGLLLCPNHDKLFDSGLISFDESKHILISKQLSENDRLFMNVSDNMKVECDNDCMKYLIYHRKHLFDRI